MKNEGKIVTQIPLTNLWTDKEDIYAQRKRYLTDENIHALLKKTPIEFVIADLGMKLEWISGKKSFDFWKSKVKSHIANDIDKIDPDKFPDNYAYVASEWLSEIGTPIILLEKYH
ncbi:MAG: hypothetical protein SFU87_17500 [Chitinophagaceae bacterium]|nr:hypothetical protein [Chitinophagaceae bacterium]